MIPRIPWHKCYYLTDLLEFAATQLSKKEIKVLELALTPEQGEVTCFSPEEILQEGPDCWDPEYLEAANLIRKLNIKDKTLTILVDW